MKADEFQKPTVLLEAFKALLDATPGEFAPGKISVWDYSNAQHFDALWSAIEDGALTNAGKVLVVWSRTLLDESLAPINTAEHVSPLHWAACAAKETQADQPPIQVAILDLNPAAHQNEYLHKFVRSLERGRLRWLRLLQAAEFFGEYSSDGACQADAALGDGETLKKRLFPQIKASQRNISPDLLRDRIREKLTSPSSPDDRHAIANVVAPMLLLSEDSSSRHSKSLRIILQCACDLPRRTSADREEYQGFDLGLLHIAPPEFVLVDDQANHGWQAWLLQQTRRIFGAKKGQPVTPVSLLPPDSFLLQIERADSIPFRFRFETSDADQRPQIVLLDLRLFSGRSLDEELQFLSRIADVCERHLSSPSLDEDWHFRLRRDIGIVKEWLKAPQKETPAHHLALTLPARLISLLDYSIPVIIFSSTGQTSILKHFGPHPNVITDFEKPRFFAAEGSTLIADAESKLYRAIEKSLGFVLARSKCEKLLRLQQPQSSCTNAITHIELYVDETGKREDPDFAVGGCFAVFNHPGDALTLADEFDEILFRNGVLYFHPVCFEPHGVVKAKKQPCDAELLRGIQEAERSGWCPLIGFVRVMANKQQPPLASTGNLFDPNSADQRFVNALAALIEVFLFESVPLILGDQTLKASPNVSVSIFVAPRAAELEEAEALEAEYRFGHHRPNKNLIQSFNADDVKQLVRALLDSHSTSVSVERLVGIQYVYQRPGYGKPPRHAERFRKSGSKSVVHLRTAEDHGQGFANIVFDARNSLCQRFGVSESDLATTVVPDYRALHYVADEILSGDNAKTVYSSMFSKSLPGQFDGDFHYSVREVSRLLDAGQLAEALIALDIPPQQIPSGQLVPDSRQLAATRCARNLEHLSMQEFAQVARHCQNADIAKSTIVRHAKYVDVAKKVVAAQNEPPTDHLSMGKEYVFLSGIKAPHHFISVIRDRMSRVCDGGIESVNLFRDYRGTRCAYVKCKSADVARNLANQVSEKSWGWTVEQCHAQA